MRQPTAIGRDGRFRWATRLGLKAAPHTAGPPPLQLRERAVRIVSSIPPRARRRLAPGYWPPILVVVIVLSTVVLTLAGTAAASAAGAVGTAGLAAAEVVARLRMQPARTARVAS